jgi:hypothetical protein
MIQTSNKVVLWAIPRFHRPISRPAQNLLVSESSKKSFISRPQAPDQGEALTKLIGAAIDENPEAAACLYAWH